MKITTRSKVAGSAASLSSKDSNMKEDDDDYYEEIKMRSKLKHRRGANTKNQDLEDKVETEGKNSILNKTLSSLSKQARLSPKRAKDSPRMGSSPLRRLQFDANEATASKLQLDQRFSPSAFRPGHQTRD